MEYPMLTDIYTFGDWLKKNYVGSQRDVLLIEPVQGGLIRVHKADRSAVEPQLSQ